MRDTKAISEEGKEIIKNHKPMDITTDDIMELQKNESFYSIRESFYYGVALGRQTAIIDLEKVLEKL